MLQPDWLSAVNSWLVVDRSDNWDSTVSIANTPAASPFCGGLSQEQFTRKFSQPTTLSMIVGFTTGATHNFSLIRVNWLSTFEATNESLMW